MCPKCRTRASPCLAARTGGIFDPENNNQRVDQQGVVAIVPPRCIKIHLYRCDSKFIVDPLEDLFASTQAYGIVTVTGEEATLNTVCGRDVHHHETITTFIKNKHKRGGQSQNRFQRLRCIQVDAYVKTVSESAVALYRTDSIAHVFITGAAEKCRLIMAALPADVQAKTSLTAQTVREIVDTFDPRNDQANEEVAVFYDHMARGSNLLVYGNDHTWEALEGGLVNILYLTNDYYNKKWLDMAESKKTRVVQVPHPHRFASEFAVGGILRFAIE